MNDTSTSSVRRNDFEESTNVGIKKIPSVAIVILNWNGKHFLQKFLPSVLASTYQNKRVIVADNASTDDSVTFLQQHFPKVEIIQNAKNEGFAKGYNTALQQVNADYFVLLNSDVEVTLNWIEPIISLMEGDEAIGICQPKLLAFDNKKQFEYAGASGGFIDYLGYPFARGRVFDTCENDNAQYEDAVQCFWASGAALFVKSNVYKQLKGLDEFFFAHQEEIDFCWRAQLSGYKIYVEPKSVVFHVGGGTLQKGSNKKHYLNFRNNLIMLYKNLPLATKIWVVPVRFFLDAVVAYKNLFSGDVGFFVAIIKAHLHFTKWLFFYKKQSVFVKVNKTNMVGCVDKSIVWRYFIKKRKTFKEIIG
jgi:GT2 family glycosyltransferase